MSPYMTDRHSTRLPTVALAITTLLLLAALCTSCSEPRLVILEFSCAAAPVLTATSATATYSWTFTPDSIAGLAESDGLSGKARLYLRKTYNTTTLAETRILAAEASLVIKESLGSATCNFTIGSNLTAGTYYVEFSIADDLGPQVIKSQVVTL